ncbi:MAG: hypothetical protein RLZZ292_3319 [Bacteroidota bacterium]|jgi:hypothetical protein
MKSFKDWERQDIELTFGLQQQFESKVLADWLDASQTENEEEHLILENLRTFAAKRIDDWNEEELKIKLIAPLMNLANMDGEKYTVFYGRTIHATVQNVPMRGEADMIIATGRQKPIKPFFFVQEYKPHLRGKNDPLGQLLAAMLVAQELNGNKIQPIYGTYILGRNWYFVMLYENNFTVSDTFDTVKGDIYTVFRILQKTKQMMNNDGTNIIS